MIKLTPDFCDRNPAEMDNFLDRNQRLTNVLADQGASTREEKVALLEEHLLVYRKPNCEPGEHVLIAASDTGGWTAIKPLLVSMIAEPRVSDISLDLTGVALYRGFQSLPQAENFQRFNPPGMPLMVKRDLLSSPDVAHAPVSLVVTTIATFHGPEVVNLLSAKTAYKAEKLFICTDTWAPIDQSVLRLLPYADQVDGVLCNDPMSKAIIEKSLQGIVNKDSVYATGTGQCIVPNELEKAALAGQVRGQLKIPEGERIIAFLGSYLNTESSPLIPKDFNLIALSDMIQQLDQSAASTTQPIHILVRPHPSDPATQQIREFCDQFTSESIKLHWAGRDQMSVDHACSAAGLIITLDSTETFKASLRGNIGAFFDSSSLRKVYQPWRAYLDALMISSSDQSSLSVIGTNADWKRILKQAESLELRNSSSALEIGKNMLNAILS